MRLQPFKTEPFLQPRPWGGRALGERMGKNLPAGPVGESWEVSAHPNGESRVADGPLGGMRLSDLMKQSGRELVGEEIYGKYGGEFSLLVKLIDVNSLASVQVHPNDEQAERLEGYPRGKTEAWYVIDRRKTARFSLGMVAGATVEVFKDAVAGGTAARLLATPSVRPGDCLFVPPGTVHAAGNGVLLLEVQQSCDITYRVYDWDRVDREGRRRELHVEKALQVMDFQARPQVFRAGPGTDVLCRILACDFFEMDEIRVESEVELAARAVLATGTLVSGSCTLESGGTPIELARGDSFVIPAGCRARLGGGRAVIVYTSLV